MIYLDSSAIVKLARREAETAEPLLPALTWFVAYDKRLADAAAPTSTSRPSTSPDPRTADYVNGRFG